MFFKQMRACLSVWYKMSHVTWQLIFSTWRLTLASQPIVAIFGGSRVLQNDVYAKQARDLAQLLVNEGISIITGGGTGIMEAANCALPPAGSKAKSIGIGVKGVIEARNRCVQEYFLLDYFFARKWLFTHFASACVIFPGGYGTLEELAEVITHIQTKQMQRMPIILVGTDYWKDFMKWLHGEAFKHGLIVQSELDLFTITDDLNEVFCLVRDQCVVSVRKS